MIFSFFSKKYKKYEFLSSKFPPHNTNFYTFIDIFILFRIKADAKIIYINSFNARLLLSNMLFEIGKWNENVSL